ncbi:MAG: histidine kinase [Firmicutes bacterium HGW-Firmicutes-14]|jgi:two-component system sensor histidine kinase DegS|nr:MAG: histidine kinase [Firmicutes bacterium HGW-Firmicutes-14]
MGNLNKDNAKRDLVSLDQVVKNTIQTLEKGREQLFKVAENARNECSRLKSALTDIDEQLNKITQELSTAGDREKEAQSRVALITDQFEKYTEKEIKAAYEEAKELHVKLTLLRERREHLKNKIRELDSSLANQRETAEKAEDMVSQVGVVMDFIRGNLRDINVKLESLQQKQQMGLEIIRAQEEERKRVAREIHDGPAQSMANVVLRMEFCEKLLEVEPPKVGEELRLLKEVVRNNLQDVRKIIFDLRPMALDDLGVVPALKRYIEDFREKNDIDIEMNFYGRETRLEPALEIALFRLVQEALNNVIKHARAAKVTVDFQMKSEWVKASIKDDGIGFDLEDYLAMKAGNHFGLISMRERIDLLGGELDIDTKPGGGTTVSFTVPVAG